MLRGDESEGERGSRSVEELCRAASRQAVSTKRNGEKRGKRTNLAVNKTKPRRPIRDAKVRISNDPSALSLFNVVLEGPAVGPQFRLSDEGTDFCEGCLRGANGADDGERLDLQRDCALSSGELLAMLEGA